MDQNIIDQLYKKYYREVYLYLFSLCKNHHLTEELVSDTFLKAILSLDAKSNYAKYWLLHVAKNLWIDAKRKKVLDQLDYTFQSDDLGPLDTLIANEKNRQLYQGIFRLQSQYQEILILYYFMDYSLKEIAQIKKISSGAARTLLYRARNKLKIVMDGE